MLPRTHRLTTRETTRLFNRPTTQKIAVFPFVFFVGSHGSLQQSKWGIQLSTKISKSSVKRHLLKRVFYSAIQTLQLSPEKHYTIMAVPQKNRHDEIVQLLATGTKNTIVPVIQKQFITCLSSFSKKLGSSAESSVQSHHYKKTTDVLKKKKSTS